MDDRFSIDVLWIPLGAGQHVVRWSGRCYETWAARRQHRGRADLYHSAIVVTTPTRRVVIEMTPVPDRDGDRRGVVAVGSVGSRLLRWIRWFRYEVRRWENGTIPDESETRDVIRVALDDGDVERLLDIAGQVPSPVWGRDELGTGEMWNSNSVTSWILATTGLACDRLGPPEGGRAPGWDAGLVLAARAQARAHAGGGSTGDASTSMPSTVIEMPSRSMS